MMQKREKYSRQQEGNLNARYCVYARLHLYPCLRALTSCGHCSSASQSICQINRGPQEQHLHSRHSWKTALSAVAVIENALLPSSGLET